MNEREFCYWLKGFFEIDDALPEAQREGLSKEQAQVIKDHLNLVFEKVTPDRKLKELDCADVDDKSAEEILKKSLREIRGSYTPAYCSSRTRIC